MCRRKGAGRNRYSKDAGNVGDLMITGILILSMMVILLAFFENLQLIRQKSEVNQLTRQYILRMETVGGLIPEDEALLLAELEQLGVEAADLSGTTRGPAGYGARIQLQITGLLGGKHEFKETRVSTAKH